MARDARHARNRQQHTDLALLGFANRHDHLTLERLADDEPPKGDK